MARKILSMRKFDHEEAARLYELGMSTPKIAAHYGVKTAPVYNALKKQGVTMRSIGDGVSGAKRGNRRVDAGYITVAAGKNIRKKEHVLLAESVLGRRLKKGEMVHHINCRKTDNRPENLLICTIAYHTALHHRMRKSHYWKQVEIDGRNAK